MPAAQPYSPASRPSHAATSLRREACFALAVVGVVTGRNLVVAHELYNASCSSATATSTGMLDAQGRSPDAPGTPRRSDPTTTRRFRYGGRFLLRHGRSAQAIAELDGALLADPNDAEAAALLREARDLVAGAALPSR